MSRFRRVSLVALAAAAALAADAGAAGAQSLLSGTGLGYGYGPLDARARALGGVALGLPGLGSVLVDPTAMAGLPAPALGVTFQPEGYDARLGGQETDGTVTRFPLIQAAFPIGRRFSAAVGYGSFLDQHWSAEASDSIVVDGTRYGVTDRFVSEGGIARLRGAVAYRPSTRLAVGVGVDVYSGVVRDSVYRFFGEEAGFIPAVVGVDRAHRGVGLSAGVRWSPTDAFQLGAAVTGGGEITAEVEATEARPAVEKAYPNPLTVHVGGSARVADELLLAASGEWAGWGAAADELAASGGARDAASASAGVEYDGFGVLGRDVPLRVGVRWRQLPFRWTLSGDGEPAFPDEMALTGGLGVRLAGGAAVADLAAERGWRGSEDALVDESYWRVTVSLTLLGR